MYNVWWTGKKQSSDSKGLLTDKDWLEFIQKFKQIKGRTNLRKAHIYIFLMYAYGENRFVSRYILKNVLNLSETSTRTFLKKMVSLNVASTIKGGHHLTLYGTRLAQYLMNKIKEVEISNDIPFHYEYSWGVAINHPFRESRLYTLRDTVIRNGGDAALILLLEKDDIVFPESKDRLSNYNEKLSRNLLRELERFPAKFIIISFSNEKHMARLSALDTALDYLEWG